jgi:hypothetical protein
VHLSNSTVLGYQIQILFLLSSRLGLLWLHWTNNSSCVLLCEKLKFLKKSVINWQKRKNNSFSGSIPIEAKLSELFESRPSQIFKQEELNLMRALKTRKENILAIEESTWRLRSRALWMKKGDKNTSFFHKYATQRRIQNSIWDITNDDGFDPLQ